jgi:hypothetical protein
MKRLGMAVVVVLVGGLGIALMPRAGATPDPKSQFIGDWEICDPADGTSLLLSIRGGHGPLHLKATDDSAAGCPSDGPAMMIGKGAVDAANPGLLRTQQKIWCIGYPESKIEAEVPIPYDALVSAGECDPGGDGGLPPPPDCGPGEFCDGGGIINCIDLDPSDGYDLCAELP